MLRLTKKRAIVAAVTVSCLALAAGAYAYFTSTGTGTATATLSSVSAAARASPTIRLSSCRAASMATTSRRCCRLPPPDAPQAPYRPKLPAACAAVLKAP